jgi:hypothetical protein
MLNVVSYLLNYYRKNLNKLFLNNNSLIFGYLQIDLLRKKYFNKSIFLFFFKTILINILINIHFELIYVKDLFPNIDRLSYKFLKGIFDLYYDVILIFQNLNLSNNINFFFNNYYDFFL